MPTMERLKELFDYRQGRLFWRTIPHFRFNKSLLGKHAGTRRKNGYRQICVDGKIHAEHRLIWIWHNGDLGCAEIDHINLIVDDNRIENLRKCDRIQNSANRFAQKNNVLGIKGIHRRPSGRYVAFINRRYLGSFSSAKEAARSYKIAAQKLYGEFARAN